LLILDEPPQLAKKSLSTIAYIYIRRFCFAGLCLGKIRKEKEQTPQEVNNQSHTNAYFSFFQSKISFKRKSYFISSVNFLTISTNWVRSFLSIEILHILYTYIELAMQKRGDVDK
jgi:hypothetical protein